MRCWGGVVGRWGDKGAERIDRANKEKGKTREKGREELKNGGVASVRRHGLH